jgi:hypothetical protein
MQNSASSGVKSITPSSSSTSVEASNEHPAVARVGKVQVRQELGDWLEFVSDGLPGAIFPRLVNDLLFSTRQHG